LYHGLTKGFWQGIKPGSMMNLRYASSFALILFLTGVHAQEFISLQDLDGNVVNGTMVVHVGDVNDGVFEEDITATLVAGATRNINVRRYEVDVQPATGNYFCWGVCYGPQDAGALPVWNAQGQHALALSAGVVVTNFHAYHEPRAQVGNSTYRYVWFDTTTPTDSVWVDIQFQAIDNVGVEELVASASINAFPNPSKGEDVQFQLDVRNVDQALDLVVFNALGERVRTITVRQGQPLVRLSTANMSEGMYFASVQRAGTTLATRRFVVTGR
jgi:hypothetical protein